MENVLKLKSKEEGKIIKFPKFITKVDFLLSSTKREKGKGK